MNKEWDKSVTDLEECFFENWIEYGSLSFTFCFELSPSLLRESLRFVDKLTLCYCSGYTFFMLVWMLCIRGGWMVRWSLFVVERLGWRNWMRKEGRVWFGCWMCFGLWGLKKCFGFIVSVFGDGCLYCLGGMSGVAEVFLLGSVFGCF